MEQFRGRSLTYRPKLNRVGQLTAFVIQQIALHKTNLEIIDASQELFLTDSLSAEELDKKVRSMIAYLSK